MHDLSESRPDKLDELLQHWDKYVEECGVIPLHPELGAYLEATEEQMEVSQHPGVTARPIIYKGREFADNERFLGKRMDRIRVLEVRRPETAREVLPQSQAVSTDKQGHQVKES